MPGKIPELFVTHNESRCGRFAKQPRRLAELIGWRCGDHRRAAPTRRGCFTKVTDRKLFVIEPRERRSASRQINRADPAEALRSAPDAPVYAGSPSRCCLAPMPLVCETASVRSESLERLDQAPGSSRIPSKQRCAPASRMVTVGHRRWLSRTHVPTLWGSDQETVNQRRSDTFLHDVADVPEKVTFPAPR